MVHLPTSKRCVMIRERNIGYSFYSQNSGRFIPFFSCGLFIGKGIFLFIQGHFKGRSQDTKYLIIFLSLGDTLEKGIQGVVLMRGDRG